MRLTCAVDGRVIASTTTIAAGAAEVAAEPEAAAAALRIAAAELARKLVDWLDRIDASSCVAP